MLVVCLFWDLTKCLKPGVCVRLEQDQPNGFSNEYADKSHRSRMQIRSKAPTDMCMDDMTITTTSIIGARWQLKEKAHHMGFNAAKSKSLVLKKGKLSENRFKLSVEYFLRIKHKLMKSLGKRFELHLEEHGGNPGN